MNELKLRIINETGQLRTQIVNKKHNLVRNDIVFHNDSGDKLTVSFDRDMDTGVQNRRQVAVENGDAATVKFANGTAIGTRVKYTVTSANPNVIKEDPIIIFER